MTAARDFVRALGDENAVLEPIVEIFYPLPKSALIPVTVIWLGFAWLSNWPVGAVY